MQVKFEHMETERIILITILLTSLVIIVTGAYRIVISILDGLTNSYLSHSKLNPFSAKALYSVFTKY